MSKIYVEKFDDSVLRAGNICYALYKRYPNGFRFFLGYFRAKYDYDAEVEWLDAHEKDPEPVYYVAKEVSDWKLKNICDSAKYAEKLKARVKERWEAKQKANKEYKEWKAELVAKGMTESDLPLYKRKFPPLFTEPTLADMLFDGDDVEPKWEAERKIAHELADKAWELENLSPEENSIERAKEICKADGELSAKHFEEGYDADKVIRIATGEKCFPDYTVEDTEKLDEIGPRMSSAGRNGGADERQ